MTFRQQLILYITQPSGELIDIHSHTDIITAECATLNVKVVSQDDLSALSSQPAIGLELMGEEVQLDLIERRLIEKGYIVEDGGREVRALDEERGEQ